MLHILSIQTTKMQSFGATHDGRIVYDYDKMVEYLMNNDGWSDIEAIEWIEYNVIRSIPYMGSDAPIVMYPLEL